MGTPLSGGGSEKWGAESFRSSLSQAMQQSLKAEAATMFLRAVHQSFPMSPVDMVTMSEEDPYGRMRVNRVFTKKRYSEEFAIARQKYVDNTLKSPLPPNPSKIDGSAIVWQTDGEGARADYTSPDFDNIEVDCIVKIAAPPDLIWTQDNAVITARTKDCSKLSKVNEVPELPSSTSPRVVPTDWERPRTGSFTSTSSERHYHPDANMYVVGEVYHPQITFDDDDADKVGHGVQKMLRLERTIQFLCAKEKTVNPLDCIAGAMFIGPKFDKATDNILRQLRTFEERFPCLSALQSADRLFTLKVSRPSVVAASYFHDTHVLRREIQELKMVVDDLRKQREIDVLSELLKQLKSSSAAATTTTATSNPGDSASNIAVPTTNLIAAFFQSIAQHDTTSLAASITAASAVVTDA